MERLNNSKDLRREPKKFENYRVGVTGYCRPSDTTSGVYYWGQDYEDKWLQEFAYSEKEKALKGLTFGGLTDSKKLVSLNSFNLEELMCAQDIIKCYFYSPSGRYHKFNEVYSSYGLKHVVEDILYKISGGRINYVSNGTVILAMHHCGFKFQHIPGTPNCLLNDPQKCYKRMEDERNCKI